MEYVLNYGLNRVWCLAYSTGKSEIAIGHDGGTAVVKVLPTLQKLTLSYPISLNHTRLEVTLCRSALTQVEKS